VTTDEDEFDAVLRQLQAMWDEATGSTVPHDHLVALLDPATRRDPSTRNYLAATASGTLQDRWFSPANGDKLPPESVEEFNRRYRELLERALDLADRLGLPAAADRRR
jgi:hypothetical protein